MTKEKPVYPSGAEKPGDEFVTGFMCKTDWEYEMGRASGGNAVYPSVEDLRKHQKCVDGCGIVEVRVAFVQTIQEEAELWSAP